MRRLAGLVFAYGFFCIGVQTLLFREYVGALEGSDLGIGLFFTSWFLWVAIGAHLTRCWSRRFTWSVSHIELVTLAYIPAFALELLLFVNLRRWTGIESYTGLSLGQMLIGSLATTWPISLLTGWLFPVLSTKWTEEHEEGVTAVYILEAGGSCAGGVIVTLLLARGWLQEAVFIAVTFVLLAGVLSSYCGKMRCSWRTSLALGLMLLLAGLGVLATKADRILSDQLGRMKWQALLPAEGWQGAFRTPQAEYLYGTYENQWAVLSEGAVVETLPDAGRDGALAALVMAQNPGAERVLVIGASLGLCRGFLELSPIQRVDWFTPDRSYVDQLLAHVPASFHPRDQRLHVVDQDVRDLLQRQSSRYDLVIVNLAGQIGAAVNRYYTEEFYQQVQAALTDGGILMVTVPGAENILGPELAYMGASVRQTLRSVFAENLVVPGERMVFMATDLHYLDDEPGPLRDRFAGIKGSHRVYAADGLLSLYRPERAREVGDAFEKVRRTPAQLINRDNQPRFYLTSLLWAARRSGVSLVHWADSLEYLGVWLAILPMTAGILIYGLYVQGHRPRRTRPEAVVTGTAFTSRLLVGLSGAASIGTVIILMTRYETLFGSLYLYVGLVSSVFMVGLSLGALGARRLLKNRHVGQQGFRLLFLTVLLFHAGGLFALSLVSHWPLWESWFQSPIGLVSALALVGLCTGIYIPWAARLLQGKGGGTQTVAGTLESMDHLGAAGGGFLTSLVLIPFLGLATALQCLAVFLVANIAWEIMRTWRMEQPPLPSRRFMARRRWGYTLLAVSLAVIAGRHLITWSRTSTQAEQNELPSVLLPWTEGHEARVRTAALPVGPEWAYHELVDEDESGAYVLQTERLVPRIYGFGGPIHMALLVSPEGMLQDFRLLRHYETPSYIWSLDRWFGRLIGKNLWGEDALQQVHAVSGATYTSEAVIEILQHSGRNFSQFALGIEPGHNGDLVTRSPRRSTDTEGLLLTGLILASLMVIHWGRLSLRLALLGSTVITCGFWLNMQFSTEQIVSLLFGRLPQAGINGHFVLLVGIPVLLLLFGNFYCGYLCPFGAFQELLGFLWPQHRKIRPGRETLQRLRSIKYLILFFLVVLYFIGENRSLMNGDPLVWFFKKNALQELGSSLAAASPWRRLASFIAGSVVLIGVLLSTRFWCRTLCPTGAFLSLSNRVALLQRWRPDYKYGRCEFGLTGRDHQECLACDRCRFGPPGTLPQGKAKADHRQGFHNGLLTLLVLLVAALWLLPALEPLWRPLTSSVARSLPRAVTSGQPRQVDTAQLGELIKTQRLSDHEALYYQPIENVGDPNDMPRE